MCSWKAGWAGPESLLSPGPGLEFGTLWGCGEDPVWGVCVCVHALVPGSLILPPTLKSAPGGREVRN